MSTSGSITSALQDFGSERFTRFIWKSDCLCGSLRHKGGGMVSLQKRSETIMKEVPVHLRSRHSGSTVSPKWKWLLSKHATRWRRRSFSATGNTFRPNLVPFRDRRVLQFGVHHSRQSSLFLAGHSSELLMASNHTSRVFAVRPRGCQHHPGLINLNEGTEESSGWQSCSTSYVQIIILTACVTLFNTTKMCH